jgi:hypothetical protein
VLSEQPLAGTFFDQGAKSLNDPSPALEAEQLA